VVSNLHERFLVLVLLEEVEDEIAEEDECNSIINVLKWLLDFCIKGYIEHSSNATVSDDDQDAGVENSLPLAVHTDDEVLRAEVLSDRKLALLAVAAGLRLLVIVLFLHDLLEANVLVELVLRILRFINHSFDILHSIKQFGSPLDLLVLLELVHVTVALMLGRLEHGVVLENTSLIRKPFVELTLILEVIDLSLTSAVVEDPLPHSKALLVPGLLLDFLFLVVVVDQVQCL